MQFVMEVDEMLFEAFAPKRLKKVLEHGKTIEMKPLRRLFGMDLAPMLKLLLTSLMIGLMAGLSIGPQTEYLRAAGDALCGKCGRCWLARPALLIWQPRLRRRSTRLGIRHRQGALQRAVQCRVLSVPYMPRVVPFCAPSLACRALSFCAPSLACRAVPSLRLPAIC